MVCPKLHKERVSDQLNGFLERLTLLARLGMTPLALSPAIEHKVRHPGSGTDRVGPAEHSNPSIQIPRMPFWWSTLGMTISLREISSNLV